MQADFAQSPGHTAQRLIADLGVGGLSVAEHDLLASVERFVRERVVPEVGRLDREDRYPADLIEEMRRLGLFGLPTPRRFGGLEARPSIIACTAAVLSGGWLSLAALLGSHWRVATYLSEFGTAEQMSRLLPRLATGEIVAAHALSEARGKDPKRLSTTLLTQGSASTISGRKSFVTNGANADLIAVACRRQGSNVPPGKRADQGEGLTVVLLERDRPGLVVGANLERMGVKGVSLCSLLLDGVPVDPTVDCVGGDALDANSMLEGSRLPSNVNYAARAVGVGESILDSCAANLGTDREGKRLEDLQAVRFRFGWLATRQSAARLMFSRFLQTVEARQADPEGAEMCKVFASRTAVDLARGALLLCGGEGYTEQQPLARHLRDALSLEIVGRPNDALLERIGSVRLRAGGMPKT